MYDRSVCVYDTKTQVAYSVQRCVCDRQRCVCERQRCVCERQGDLTKTDRAEMCVRTREGEREQERVREREGEGERGREREGPKERM